MFSFYTVQLLADEVHSGDREFRRACCSGVQGIGDYDCSARIEQLHGCSGSSGSHEFSLCSSTRIHIECMLNVLNALSNF